MKSNWFRRQQREGELNTEIRNHLDEAIRDHRLRMLSRLVVLALIASFFPATVWPQTEPALIPRKAIFAGADKEQVMLSPDGKWIGYRALNGGAMNLWVAPVNEPAKARAVTQQSAAPVVDYRWTNLSGRVLYRIPADGGVQVFMLNLDSGESRNLTPGKGVTAFIEKLSPDHVEEALLRVKEPAQASFDYRRVNLGAGAAEIVFKNERNFERVLFDDDWRPRVALSRKPNAGFELWQPNAAGEWISFASFRDGAEANGSQPIVLDKSGKTLYLTDNRGRDKAALQSIDLASGKETLLLEDPFADVLPALLVHPKTGRVQTASTYYGRLRRHFLDPTLLPDFEYLRTVARGDIGLLSPWGGRSLDDGAWLVVFLDGGPTRFYVYDRAARRATFLFTEYKALDAYTLGRRHLEVITARDGLELPADLYLPKIADPDVNGRPRQPLPLLIYVHGGPWVAYPWNDWNTNRTLQLLADRGYAVLRVEFRAAVGLGRNVNEAGTREWGGKMQDDLIDAADWAIKQGITTRERIGIWGWSYGGYATLQALATTDRFACGLAMYAPTELDSFIAEANPGAQAYWRRLIGDNTTEAGRALLKKVSPFHYAASFAKPALIAQGGKDAIVPQRQADRFVAELQKYKKPVTYLLYPDEPHDFQRPENWASLFAIAERFFHDHLGGRYEPFGNDLRGSGLETRAGGELIPGLVLALNQKPSSAPMPQDHAPKRVVEKDQLKQGKELLQRAQRAVGGAEKLAAVKDAMHKMEIALEPAAGGFKLKQTSLFVAPNYIRQEQEDPSGKFIFYSDGKAGWMSTPQGVQPMPAEVLHAAKGVVFRQTATLLLSDRDASRTVKAIGDNAVEISTTDGLSVRLEFDPATGLLARQLYTETSANGSPRERVEELSDWRDVGGVKMYFKGVLRENGAKMLELIVSEWKINNGLTAEQLSRKA